MPLTLPTGAHFSPCRRWRYDLWRSWIGGDGYAMFIGLNPSTADETRDDPTVRRCIRFAQAWGYAGLCMTNIFAWRDTDPRGMKAAADPVGPENDRVLRARAADAGVVVAAWGMHGAFMGRGARVAAMLGPLHCLRVTAGGFPAHPLYLPKTLRPVPWRPT